MYFRALQRFEPRQIAADDWRMHTLEYKYELWEPQPDRTTKPVIEWHWHPRSGTVDGCHLHLRASEAICGIASRRLHIPSERVAFESVVRFLIEEVGVEPRHPDWERRITEALESFMAFRSWSGSHPPN